jgi:hypothetical protein
MVGVALGVVAVAVLVIWGLSRGNNSQQVRVDDPPAGQRPEEKTGNNPNQPPARRVVAKPWEPNPALFLKVQATDGTFTVLVPHGWTVKSCNMDVGLNQGLTLWGPRGDMVFEHAVKVSANQPALSPAEAMQNHYPGLYTPLMQGLRLLDSKDLPLPPFVAQASAQLRLPAKAALVHYQYTLQRNDQAQPWVRGLFPPALTGQQEVAMKGRAQVITMALPPLGIGPNTWTVSITGVEAPADVFDVNQFFYEHIARSVVEDPAAITRKVGRAYVKNQELCQAFLRAGANAQQQMLGAAEFFNYQVTRGVSDDVGFYSEHEQRIYTVPAGQANGGAAFVTPGGEVLRPLK